MTTTNMKTYSSMEDRHHKASTAIMDGHNSFVRTGVPEMKTLHQYRNILQTTK